MAVDELPMLVLVILNGLEVSSNSWTGWNELKKSSEPKSMLIFLAFKFCTVLVSCLRAKEIPDPPVLTAVMPPLGLSSDMAAEGFDC